jgi:hypothetical protein
MVLLRAHLDDKYPRFVYHDGVFESLDDRKKENLLTVIRRYAELGLQPIITLIDSDLPARTNEDEPVLTAEEIVVTLHDEGDHGKLFKIREWYSKKWCMMNKCLSTELPHRKYSCNELKARLDVFFPLAFGCGLMLVRRI